MESIKPPATFDGDSLHFFWATRTLNLYISLQTLLLERSRTFWMMKALMFLSCLLAICNVSLSQASTSFILRYLPLPNRRVYPIFQFSNLWCSLDFSRSAKPLSNFLLSFAHFANWSWLLVFPNSSLSWKTCFRKVFCFWTRLRWKRLREREDTWEVDREE